MLDRLDKISWSSLTHAYGKASDVPDQIRALVSENEEEREQALWQLYGNVFHQGSRYEATPFVVPFLYELLANDSTPAKQDIIYLLVNLALGYPDYYLPDGINTRTLAAEFNELDGGIESQCYHAVREGVPQLCEFINHEDDDVRRAALYELAWFPSEASRSIPIINRVLSTDSGVYNAATATLSLGLLRRNSEVSFDEYQIRRFLTSDSRLLSTCAAIALAGDEIETDIMELLIRTLISSDDLEGLTSEVLFNGGDLVGYAGMWLARYGKAARETVIPALCSAMRLAPVMRSMNLTQALLDIIVVGNDLTQQFDELDRDGLLTIANHGAWKIGDGIFANYSLLLRSHGLPDTSEGLKKFVADHG